jgi:hypothetical protein
MPSERRRVLELALESLQRKKHLIDDEIAVLTRAMRRGGAARSMKTAGAPPPKKAGRKPGRKRPRFSKEERARRSARMKAYWEKRRKEKGQG